LRGLHCSPYGKFITCVRGAFYDVIADFREDSPTFGRWCGVLLTEHNKKQVYVPAKCGHGFFTFEDNTCALYLQEGCFNPPNEADNHPFDKLFNVAWPVPEGVTPVMSAKDVAAPPLYVRRPHLATLEPRGRILVIGASGQVGGALLEAYGERNCIGTYCGSKVEGMVHFDLEKSAMQPQLAEDLMQSCYPTVVCICAGFTWVDGCENQPAKANQMNNRGPAVVAAAAKAVGAKVVWYSTDYVFDGGVKEPTSGPYGEEDPVSPLNVYGASKLDGEKQVLAADPEALVLRTNVVFGPEGVGKNFVYQLVGKLRAGTPMNVPLDQVNTPTYNRDLAAATKLLVEAGASGLYNVGGGEVLGRADFGTAVVAALNELQPSAAKLDPSLIKGVTTSNAGQTAMRPLASGLKLDKVSAVLGSWKPRSVAEAIKDWVDNPRGKPLP